MAWRSFCTTTRSAPMQLAAAAVLWRLGIRYGVAIEFDTYQNAAFGDIANDHTNFIDTDAPLAQARLSAARLISATSRTASGTSVQVSWDAPSRR